MYDVKGGGVVVGMGEFMRDKFNDVGLFVFKVVMMYFKVFVSVGEDGSTFLEFILIIGCKY